MKAIVDSDKSIDYTQQVSNTLFLLQEYLEEFTKETDRSYALIKIGTKTPLAKQIEETIENPLNSMLEMSNQVDNTIKFYLDSIIKGYLLSNRSIVKKAFRSKTQNNDLHYTIVLVDDNNKYRTKLFSFLNDFDIKGITERFPIYFQFVPESLIEKIQVSEEIILASA